MKTTLGVIPARMASSRFPGKPLKKILGIPMIAHCYERAMLSGVCDKLVVATPDQEILDWAKLKDIPSVLTSYDHLRATDRAKETLDILSKQGDKYDLVLLIQGDEPQIFPRDVINLRDAFSKIDSEVINLIYPIKGNDLINTNVVKVIVDRRFNINFFSRSHIPFNSENGFRQLGMIGFTNHALHAYSKLPPSSFEELESIDMMRYLENDLRIQGVISSTSIFGVDTPKDIIKVEKMMLNDKFVNLYKEKYI